MTLHHHKGDIVSMDFSPENAFLLIRLRFWVGGGHTTWPGTLSVTLSNQADFDRLPTKLPTKVRVLARDESRAAAGLTASLPAQ
jgi:hypothetical protein